MLWISVFSDIHLSPLETVHHGNKWTNCEGMNFFSEIQTHLSQQLQPIRLETTYFFLKKTPNNANNKKSQNKTTDQPNSNIHLDTKPLEIP